MDISTPIRLEGRWNWQRTASVYTKFTTNLGALGVKPTDVSTGSQYLNNDKAGSTENCKPYVIAGARGAGGTDHTGQHLGPTTVPPVVQVPNSHAIVLRTTTVTLSGSATDDGLPNHTLNYL